MYVYIYIDPPKYASNTHNNTHPNTDFTDHSTHKPQEVCVPKSAAAPVPKGGTK